MRRLGRAPVSLADLLLLGVGFWGAGCASAGIDPSKLPGEPLAFVYRTEDEASRRLELEERSREDGGLGPAGRVRLETVSELLGLSRTPEQRRADQLGRLVLMDARDARTLPQEWALRGARPLDWSADHQRLLFMSRRDGSAQIFEYDRGQGELRQKTRGPDFHIDACYGPDGWLAVQQIGRGAGQEELSSRIAVSHAGGALRPLSPGPMDSAPAWSPDGRVLLYVIDASSDRARIAALDPEIDGEPRIIARGRSPAFTSDGAWVVYSTPTRQGWELRRMRPDGSGKLPLGRGPGEAHMPAPSPDGRYVAYTGLVKGREQLRLRTLDGRSDRPLLGAGEGAMAVWN